MTLAEELAKKFEVSIHGIRMPVNEALERAALECDRASRSKDLSQRSPKLIAERIRALRDGGQ